jgi:hypothetical protein
VYCIPYFLLTDVGGTLSESERRADVAYHPSWREGKRQVAPQR